MNVLASYKKIGNRALAVSAAAFCLAVILGSRATGGNIWQSGGAPAILMFVIALGIWVAFWAYAKAKGRPGWLGIALAMFSLIGLIVLLALKDRHPQAPPHASA